MVLFSRHLFLLAFMLSPLFAVESKKDLLDKEGLEKKALESEVLDFKKIKKVLSNDMLGENAKKKEKVIKKAFNKSLLIKKDRYNIPEGDDFWSFVSEYWLVKNAAILKWDFKKPDYGLEKSFARFLEKMGLYEKRFRILVLNSPDVSHFALPAGKNDYLLVISLPFIRTLDLSKLEISIILLEDILRADGEYFKQKVSTKEVVQLEGRNFFKEKTFNKKVINELLKRYDDLIFDKGFDFKVQFDVTKKVSALFRSDMKIWNTYFKMLNKIDELVKNNILYQKYLRIYPSPELQLEWLRPKAKEYQRL